MDPWLLVTLVSGAAMALFGVFLFAADPKRDWNRTFALFAVFWGAQILAANAVRLIDDRAVAGPVATMSLALLIPLYFFIVVFASIFPRPIAPFGMSSAAMGLLLVPAALALVLLVFAPRLLLDDVVAVASGGSTMQWGPLFPVLVLAPLYAGFFHALFVMMQRLRRAATDLERRQVTLVLAALGVFVAYNVPLQLVLFGSATIQGAARDEADLLVGSLIALVMLAGLVLLFVLGLRLRARMRSGVSRTVAREARNVLIGAIIAACIGLAEGIIAAAGLPRPQMVGLVRTAAVGLIAYGIARYQLFDLDLRVKHATQIATTLLLLASLGILGWTVLRSIGGTPLWWWAGVVALVLVAAAPATILVRRVTDRLAPHVSSRGDHLYLRKLEVYRAALADTEQDAASLERLRARLGLDAEDHRVAMRLVAPAAVPEALAPGRLAFDRYLIASVAGEGTYGRVFVARDLRSGRRVAIKELDARWRGQPAVFQRFLREARIMGRLVHPNIVALHDVEERGGDRFLVLEHIDGGSLAERLSTGRLPEHEAVRLAREIASALRAAHARGIVHRDLKPANVLLDLEGQAKLTDFGVAGVLAAAPDATFVGLPAPGDAGVAGNLLYMAPEQARGASDAASADLYALGAILYHMLVGRPHRDLAGLDSVAARDVVANDRIPDLAKVPVHLRDVLARLLAPDPARRPVDAGAVLALLPETASSGRSGVATSTTTTVGPALP